MPPWLLLVETVQKVRSVSQTLITPHIGPCVMLGFNIEVTVRFIPAVTQEKTEEVIANVGTPGGAVEGHGLGTPKTCSQCGKVGFNLRTCPGHNV